MAAGPITNTSAERLPSPAPDHARSQGHGAPADESSEALPQNCELAPTTDATTATAPLPSAKDSSATSAEPSQGPDGQEPAVASIEPIPTRKEAFFTYFELLVYANPTWKDYILLVGGLVISAAAGVPIPLMGIFFGQLVDDLNQGTCDAKDRAELLKASPDELQHSVNEKVLKLLYIGIASFTLIYAYLVCWAIFSRRLEARIRDAYFRSILRQDAAFYDKRPAGELSSRLNADMQTIQSGTSEKVGICIACTSFFVTAYAVGFAKDAKLAGMLISLIPAFLLLSVVGSYFTQKFTTAMSNAIASASSVAQETLSHIAVVQAFSAGPRLEARFAACMGLARSEGIKKAFAAALQAGMLYFIAYSANALAFWQGSRQIADAVGSRNGTSVGDIYVVIFLLVDACIILGSIAPYLPMLGAAAATFRKVRQDIEAPISIDSGSDKGEKLPLNTAGSIKFDGVTFAYVSRPERPVLKKVSFDCPSGKYTALVGLSGSGKSTVAGLTTRLYDPVEGAVTLDGRNLQDLNVKSLRSFMSLVQQEPSLLSRSILENIALGVLNSPWERHQKFQAIIDSPILARLAADLREGVDLNIAAQELGADVVELVDMVREAAKLADATSFIETLERGYGTDVGIGGKLVSGGQRQRIALARALIRDPRILILDEATSSLDSASERRIQAAVESIAQDRTLIAIAHRLSTIKNADNIIVMSNGEIIEQGTHSDLMALDGNYASMVRLQNIEAERHDDSASLASTARGDVETDVPGHDSIAKDDEPVKAHGEIANTNVQTTQGDEEVSAVQNDLDANKSASTVIWRMLKLIRPNFHWLLIAMFAGTIVGLTFSASGLIFGNTIGNVSPCNTTSHIRWAGRFFGGLFFMLAVVELLANSASWSGFGYVAEKLLYRIRILTFRSLYQQDMDWHQASGRTPASLLSVITADTAAVGGFSGSIIGTMFSIMVNFLVAIIMSHIIAWKIAVVCLVTVPLLLGSGVMQVRSLSQFERKHASAFSSAIGITVEAINSFKTISSLSIEDEILGTYHRALYAPQKEITMFSLWTNFWLAMANSTCNLIYAFAYWWGSTRIIKGENTQTQFLIILMAMLVSAQLWGQMFSLAPEISRARAAASRILNLIDLDSATSLPREKGDTDVEADAQPPRKPSGPNQGSTITFKNVGFAYPSRVNIQILKGMSFTINAGQFCGLVGPSGAGKSTIMSLVQRMYRPSAGVIEIDGVDICAKDGAEFRDDIAVVPQDCALFEGTIKFNITMGARPGSEPTDAEVEEACRLANIHDTITALPDGYGTECGPNGSRLSGGQRQRLAIARALVRKPKLLLLDESTSALDAESERALQEGLEKAAKGITVIAITHRLHTVRKADVIFVVEGGQVVEKGRHDELVERKHPSSVSRTVAAGPLLPYRSHVTGRRSRSRPERGGILSQSTTNFDAIELLDYLNKPLQDPREQLRLEQCETKRLWLEAQDEMKFSHSIQFNAVPDWSSHYIAYSNLKKLRNAAQARSGDHESRPLISTDEPEDVFSKALGIELEKICSFYVAKEGELHDEVSQLLRDVAEQPALESSTTFRRRSNDTNRIDRSGHYARTTSVTDQTSDDDAGDETASEEEDESAALTHARGQGRRSTVPNFAPPPMKSGPSSELGRAPSTRRHSTTFDDYGETSTVFASALFPSTIMLKKRIIGLYVSLCELKSYVQLNRTGFSKVLKKFDKIMDKELRITYIKSNVDTAYPFNEETKKHIEDYIAEMESAYSTIVTGGDDAMAKKELRSHLREHVVWERNTVWRDLIGIERRGEAARLGSLLLGPDSNQAKRLQGDDDKTIPMTNITTPFGRLRVPAWIVNSSILTLLLSTTAFLTLLFIPILNHPEQQNCLAMLVYVSLLWATETLPLFATALLIPFLSVILKVVRDEQGEDHHRLNAKDATAAIFASMWSPVIMLLLGGFTVAAALSKCTIDKKLATLILSKAGTNPRVVLIANMLVAAFASMLISNVAAPVLCYSLIDPMLRTLPSDSPMSKAVIMGIALASNIGGMLSPIASPQNVVAMGIMQPAPTWLQWFFIVIPVGTVSIIAIWMLLLATFKTSQGTSIQPVRPLKEKFTAVQWFVSIVTVITIALWCASHQMEDIFGDMGVIAIIPIVVFFGMGILTKEDFNNFPWTIIILAAGGLSLGKAVRSSGLLHTLAEVVSDEVQGMGVYGVLVVFSSLILVIATFISHTVAALIFLPLVHDVGAAMNQPHPNLLVMGGVLMCSAAMGLPTSGFPNMTAIMKEDATGQRYLQVKHFISRGIPSSILTLVVVVTLGYGIMQVAGLD
ncbi:SPX domain-containing protein [Cordyceps javanica]|uniref:SPX domain-containing protein n=1 Tax=Cordyceps javanica TaxID=43265 RepID=A0A545V2U7_9HYPO|nr:SPX domain-containing protein [Cordyceps javanica]TQW06759.1 SPX domain protein [Cordyceps javanica]